MQRTTLPVLAAAAIVCANATTHAQVDFLFDKLVDTQTPVPGGTGNFRILRNISTDQGTTAFRGIGSAGEWGVYTHDSGGLRMVADNNTPSPSGGMFQTFVMPSLSNNRVSFYASTSDSGSGSLFMADGGSFQEIAGPNIPIPGRADSFTHLYLSDHSDSALAFTGGTRTYRGAFLYDGVMHTLADVDTQTPGSNAHFTDFGTISTNGGSALFRADSSNGLKGIYHSDLQSVVRILDSTDIIPGISETFSNFGIPVDYSDGVIVQGTSQSGHEGIYSIHGEQIDMLVDLDTPVPGRSGSFSQILPWVGADAGNIAFHAYFDNDDSSGVFLLVDDQLHSVIATGDTLDGRVVDIARFGLARGVLDGDSLVVNVTFTDGLSAIYMVTVPAPATLLLLALPLTRRRRSR